MEYGLLLKQTDEILSEPDLLAGIENLLSVLYFNFGDINWIGIYRYDGEELVLGPFFGKIACTHIKVGKGVCGTAFEQQKTQNVKNVHEFPGHIACDSASRSEVVSPLSAKLGVLDIDSESYERFSDEDAAFFDAVAAKISERVLKERNDLKFL